MSPSMNKKAGVVVNNLDDLARILKRSGKNFAEGSVDNTIKKMYTNGGSGSLVFDALSNIPKKVLRFGGQKKTIRVGGNKFKTQRVNTVGDKIKDSLDKAVEKYQRSATNLDMKAGGYLNDKLKNTKAKNLFKDKKQFKINRAKGKPDEILEVDVGSLSAPLNKTKKTALPIIGAFTVSSKMDEHYRKKQERGSEGGEAMIKGAYSKDELIEKIASTVSEKNIKIVIQSPDKLQEDFKKLASLANKTVEMLKVASAETKQSKSENEKLAHENKMLKLKLIASNKSDRAVKLAYKMHQNGLIKKADIEKKIDELMDMNDEAYEVVAETVDTMIEKEAGEQGIDSLAYIMDSDDVEQIRKRSMAEEIDKMAKKL